jgi:D-alanyl-D-alanine carboxypeptidase
LLERVTGIEAEKLITEEVIERCGLTDTYFPDGPDVRGPHSRLYESWFGMFEPPRDFSSFDMSWVGPAAALVSTVADLNRFFARLLEGKIIGTTMLTQMQRTVPVISFEQTMLDYGLGLHRKDMPGHGTFWGHDGSVWGGGAISMASPDGRRQLSVAINLQRWNRLDESGRPVPHPIDRALADFLQLGLGAEPS